MKSALISNEYSGNVSKFILLESIEDLTEYSEYIQGKLDKTIKRLLKSNIPKEKWDHHLNIDNRGDVIFSGALMLAKIRETSPVLESPKMALEMVNNMRKLIMGGDKVIINKNGGYCELTPFHKIEECEDFVPEDNKIYYVGKNTKVINFENDPELETRVKEYFSEQNDDNPSYILNLREFTQEDIENVLDEFHKNGGEQVYIYTTGLDTEQMWMYSQAIINSNIEHVVFEFNSGTTKEILEVVEFLKENVESVKLI